MPARTLKVLLADDVRLELEIDRTFFQRSGFLVITAMDGLSALALTSSEHPDLVILDEYMPGLTGSQVCRNLKARPETRAIPVIITSSADGEALPRVCLDAGAEMFHPKSAGREALTAAAARILRVPERKSTRLTVCFTVTGVVGGKESLGKAYELSEGGIGIETPRRYALGDAFSLRFLIPGERQELRAGACVVGVNGRPGGVFAISLRFTEMSGDDRRRLNLHLDKTLAVR